MMRSIRFVLVLLSVTLTASKIEAAEASRHPGQEQLEYYLYQAFSSRTQQERFRLNHIGIEGQQTAQGFLVNGVLQGFPAHNAGINRGDVIVSADGNPFQPVFSFNEENLAPREFTRRSRSFDLELQRNEQTLTVSISPVFENLYDSYRMATLNSVQEFSSGNKVIGYVQLWALSRNSDALFNLQQLIASLDHCDGIIVDLRGSYGFLDQAHFELFSLNEPRLSFENSPRWLQGWDSPGYPMTIETYRKPITLLIDASTRGAAELIAMALDDAERISSLGSTTAGMVGEFRFNNAELIYSPAVDFLVNESQLEANGLEPEQPVDFPFTESRRDDPQFEAAVSWLLGVI